jgi:hypothetical protein
MTDESLESRINIRINICRKSDMPQLHLLIVTYVPPFT